MNKLLKKTLSIPITGIRYILKPKLIDLKNYQTIDDNVINYSTTNYGLFSTWRIILDSDPCIYHCTGYSFSKVIFKESPSIYNLEESRRRLRDMDTF